MEQLKIPTFETIANTAKIFGLPENMVHQLAIRGEIVAINSGRKILINVNRFSDYLDSHTLGFFEEEEKEETPMDRFLKPVPRDL